MNKLLAAIVASTFVLGSVSSFAADAVKKKEELTTEQKSEIRERADRMKADRAKTQAGKTTTATATTPANAPAKTPAKGEPKKAM